MIDLNSLSTFSGLFTFAALVALLNRWLTAAGLFLTVAGAAGIGVFWERWSELAGYEVQVRALAHPVAPTTGQVVLFSTHAPMLLIGVALLSWLAWRRQGTEGA